MAPPRVGFLGLGAIGWPMAARLAGRGRLTVWNRSSARARDFAAAYDATAVGTPRELAEASDVVITCLPNSPEVESVAFGPEGLTPGLSCGALVLDCTSGVPERSRALAARLAELGVDFADAPVSGGTNGAEAGTLTVLVGATPAVFRRAESVLSAFGSRIVHVGPVGAGHAVKAVNNALLGLHILGLGEGLTALVKAGVNADTAVEVINASSGRSFVSEVLVPERVLTGSWPRTFRLALLEKDTGIACGLMESLGLPHPVLNAARRGLQSALESLADAQADYLEAIRAAEVAAGVEIRREPSGE